jgi:hypothetical protein
MCAVPDANREMSPRSHPSPVLAWTALPHPSRAFFRGGPHWPGCHHPAFYEAVPPPHGTTPKATYDSERGAGPARTAPLGPALSTPRVGAEPVRHALESTAQRSTLRARPSAPVMRGEGRGRGQGPGARGCSAGKVSGVCEAGPQLCAAPLKRATCAATCAAPLGREQDGPSGPD